VTCVDADSAKRLHISGRRGELVLRVGSALVLAPLAIAAAYVGGWPFAGFWGIAAVAVLWEWATLVAPSDRQPVLFAGAASLVLAVLLAAADNVLPAVAILAMAMLAVAALAPDGRRLWVAGGIPYAGAIGLAPVLLRSNDWDGFVAMLFVFAVVWTTDIAAFFAGRTIGGPKLLPRVSPKKTWSGAIGGLVAAIVVAMALAKATTVTAGFAIVVLAAVLSAAAQAGDLFESFLKRTFGSKDAGRLIPGHGGVMDRLDGFVSACVVAALIGLVRGGFESPGRGLLVW
jgi:phosphatidate cytidylyltransferase